MLHELLFLPEHLSSPPILVGFLLRDFLTIVLSVLLPSDYPFAIFKLSISQIIEDKNTTTYSVANSGLSVSTVNVRVAANKEVTEPRPPLG